MNRAKKLCAAMFLLILCAGHVGRSQQQNPCAQDALKFCKGLEPGGRRMFDCRMSHQAELSSGCKDYLSGITTSRGGANSKPSSLPPQETTGESVPREFQAIYSLLEKQLRDFDARLDAREKGTAAPVVFGAELLPANCNRGQELLRPQAMQGVTVSLDRLKELGVQGVTIPIHYPLYLPSFPGYEGYATFYRKVAQEVRARGMKLDVESHVMFANTSFSTIHWSFAGLTLDKYRKEKRQMVAAIVKDIQPDYIDLGAEPDTEAVLTGLKDFNDPAKYTESLKYVLEGLDHGRTRMFAGIGSWGNLDFVSDFVKIDGLDGIALHVYPVIGKTLDNALEIASIAKGAGKSVVLDEAWLLKADRFIGGGDAAWTETFRRDGFSFWAPLDQRFLADMVKFARAAGVEYLSPYWTRCFFAYLAYDAETASLSYKDSVARQNQAATANLLKEEFTSTGRFYQKLIQESR
jgi:hypothetical protein